MKFGLRNHKFSLKQIVATNILSILLMSILTISLVSAVAVINVYLDDLPAATTYTVKTDGTNFWAVRYDGYKAYESTNGLTVAQSVVDTMGASGGGTVNIQKGFSVTGTLIIRYSYISIVTDYRPAYYASQPVYIEKIKFDSTDRGLAGEYIRGIQSDLIWFYANNHAIGMVNIENVAVHPLGTNYGILFDGNTYIDYIYFNYIKIMKETDVVGYGAITFKNTAWGTGQIYFNDLNFEVWDSSATAIYIGDGAHVDFANFKGLSYSLPTGKTGNKLVNIAANTLETFANLIFSNANPLEIHAATTLFNIQNPSTSGILTVYIDLHDSFIEAIGSSVTLLNNSATAGRWTTSSFNRVSNLKFHHNSIAGGGIGWTFTLGNVNVNANWKVYVDTNSGFVTEKSGRNVLLVGKTNVTFTHGLSAQPTSVSFEWKTNMLNRSYWYTTNSSFITLSISGAASSNYEFTWSAEYQLYVPLFYDSFESNDFGAWSSVVGSPTIVTSPIYDGSYAMQVTNNGAYAKVTGMNEISVNYRFAARWTANPNVNYVLEAVGEIYSGAVGSLLSVGPWNEGGTPKFYIQMQNSTGGYQTYMTTALSLNTWYIIELRFTKGIGAQVWVNGTSIWTSTQVAANYAVTQINSAGRATGLTSTIYFDYAYADYGYIGT